MLQLEYQKRYQTADFSTVKEAIEKLSPVIQIRNEGNSMMISSKPIRKEFGRTAG